MFSKSSHIMLRHIHVWTLGICKSCHSSDRLRAVPGLPLSANLVSLTLYTVYTAFAYVASGECMMRWSTSSNTTCCRLCILKDLLSVSSVGPKLRSVVCCYSLSNLSMVNIFLMTMITAIMAGQKRRLGRISVKYSAGTKRNKESIAMDKASAVGRAR